MNLEQEPANTPDATSGEPQVLTDHSDSVYPPAGYIGELPGGGGLPQPTNDEVITEVPGFEGNGVTEPHVIDTDPDQEAIARERQSQATALYTQVAGQIALPSLPANGENHDQ